MSANAAVVDTARPELPDELRRIFKDAEARHLTEDELSIYRRLLPDWAERADAAKAAYAVEADVVSDAINRIFEVYPYAEKHKLAPEKCVRDATNVSTYAIQAMLMNDNQWYKDKLLFWLKTILQAFNFPGRVKPKESVLFGSNEDAERINGLPDGLQSLYETYLLMDRNYQQSLDEPHYLLLKPHVEIVREILTGD
ncbi:hypothetical protein HFP89_14365 [Wenzhouxiangella sp. XN79A]|uniref:hypothetical protein n=1 Tax=Wenzhouxiangella sp. XN79A TaxID=2724193 RepID=UPI00144AEFAA|nr:hypothetical protein [Wenzhouxiangella sp. XN79A]NKI36351.1 hypothetical protein [Wenzhouxiangella sp. XN79A]